MSATLAEESSVTATLTTLGGKYLTFKLDQESFGIEVLKIREIIRTQKITPVPHSPVHLLGVINLRGKVIPVLDLRIKFSLRAAATTDQSCIVVVQVQARSGPAMVGLLVDSVEEVMNIESNQIEPAPDLGYTAGNHFLRGIAKIKQDVKTLLEIDRVVLEEDILRLPS